MKRLVAILSCLWFASTLVEGSEPSAKRPVAVLFINETQAGPQKMVIKDSRRVQFAWRLVTRQKLIRRSVIFAPNPFLVFLAADGTPISAFLVHLAPNEGPGNLSGGECLQECSVARRGDSYAPGEALRFVVVDGARKPLYIHSPGFLERLGIRDDDLVDY